MRFNVKAKYDAVIIGSGISGLICAIELAKSKKSVCIITKEAVTESSSLYAQGGIAVPLSKEDSVEKHLQDTLNAGKGLTDINIAKEIINYSAVALEKLISYGVRFDLNAENMIHQTREGAHSVSRVCHIGGDASGRFITKTLIDKACREPNISISQGTSVLLLLVAENGNVNGVLVQDVTKDKYIILASNVIVATGGIGQLYKETSNPKVCTGDGIALVYRIGAELQDIEMIQFHPTVMLENGDALLITEAIRGEGGKLKNINNEYFAINYHPSAELAPRDDLSRAILSELKKTKSKHVLLDISNFNKKYFIGRFPTIYQACIDRNIDMFNSGIPVTPAAHYFIGGIKTSLTCRTNILNLWAIGECGSNGFHGANRLASNSLLECIVVPHFLVRDLLSLNNNYLNDFNDIEVIIDDNVYYESEIKNIINQLQCENSESIGLVREEQKLKKHLAWLLSLSCKFNVMVPSDNYQINEFKNMILLSLLICQAAIKREHSLGVHFRNDYPAPPDEFEHSLCNFLGRDGVTLSLPGVYN